MANHFNGVPFASLEHEAFTRLKNEVTTRPRAEKDSWVHFRTIIRHLIAAAATQQTGEGAGWIPVDQGFKDGRFYHASADGRPIKGPVAWMFSANAQREAWCLHPDDALGIVLPHDPQPTHLNPGVCPPPGHQAWRDREATAAFKAKQAAANG